MLFGIFCALVIVGIIICVVGEYTVWEMLGGAFSVFGVIGVVLSLVVICCNHIGIDGKIASMEQRYEALSYQYENDIFDNDNDLGKKELMEDIQSWNTELARLQENQDNFWLGIYRPNIYDQFEFIEWEASE